MVVNLLLSLCRTRRREEEAGEEEKDRCVQTWSEVRVRGPSIGRQFA